MGFASAAQGYKPKENQEFGPKKKLVGDAVCQLNLEEIVSKKNGSKWIVWRAVAIHPIEDAKGRETTLVSGDQIEKIYDPTDDEAIQELMDDLFTAGIEYDHSGSDEAIQESMISNAKDKLVYMRTWCRDKSKEDYEKYPNNQGSYWQSIKVLIANKITP